MDVSSPICNSKRRKVNDEHNVDGSVSNIGILPDRILQHILSFLPTKDAVGTSILSKRWQYLWTSIPNLRFNQGLLDKRRSLFMNFVERVLLLHDFSNVKKFSLTCDVLSDASRIGSWITTAVRCKVQKINICLSNVREPFVLPHCLFTCDSLMVLKVEFCYVLKLPPSIFFSSLKKLTLKDVTFSDDYSTQQLFSGCPVLEDLWIDCCIWENFGAVSISVPKLQRLTIEEYDYEGDEADQSDLHGCQVMIFGMSLETFSYKGELINDYCLYNSSSLVEACIEVPNYCQRQKEVAYRVYKLLRGLSNVRHLEITSGAVEFLDCAEELFAYLPMFNNLTYLLLESVWMHFDCKAFLKILQNSPCLRSLTFCQGVDLSTSCGEDDWILDPVPPCFLSHLKSIEIYDFYGSEKQVHLIKILLENARVLDRMFIDYSDFPEHFERRKNVNERLLMLPKTSKTCSVVLSEGISLF